MPALTYACPRVLNTKVSGERARLGKSRACAVRGDCTHPDHVPKRQHVRVAFGHVRYLVDAGDEAAFAARPVAAELPERDAQVRDPGRIGGHRS